MSKYINVLFLPALMLLLVACSRPEVPSATLTAGRPPQLSPDYVGVTVPCNICPLNFGVQEPCDRVVARVTAPGCSFTYGKGRKVIFDADEWEQLLEAACGQSMRIELFGHTPQGWVAFDPFVINVAPDSIDRYLSYRLIPPSYVTYNELIIEQRDLTSFETHEIYNNHKLMDRHTSQCINCHSYQNYRTDRMLFHIRKDYGGTMLIDHGKVTKVNLKTPETLSAGVYPAWHPTENLIAFSTNKTSQVFHSTEVGKVEVFDEESDLILYDVAHNMVLPIATTDSLLECFPTWSPDGRWLYYTAARVPFDPQAEDKSVEAILHYDKVRYDLCRRSFDLATCTFGPEEMVYRASADSLSVTLPRISPDGRWLVCSLAPYGCFHVWHPEAEIAVMDLASIEAPTLLAPLNSPQSESYPTFSSNGRWVMTASRRDDGNYTRPYIAYFDKEGRCYKPFELPQESPAFYQMSFKSFNRPEFMIEPVAVSCDDLADASRHQEAMQASYSLIKTQ